MAVTNNATLIEDHETAPSYTSVGGGQGAGAETNFYFLGIQASSRKMSGVTKNGFFFNPGATADLSAAGTHFKLYINAITQASFSDFWLRIGSSTTAYEEHAVGVAFYDNSAGGWIPVWVEVDAGTDTGTPDFTVADEYAVLCTMGSISGNVKNWCTDQAHSSTRPCLTWDGTGGDLDDFITTETTAGVGALKLLNGLYTCYSNLQIGSATSTTFDMAGKVIAFPDATWLPAASAWMGLDFDLSHASTDITATGGSVISGNPTGATARKPDIIVTGTSGTVDFSNRTFDGLRVMTLTTGVTIVGATIANSGLITLGGATLDACNVFKSPAVVALVTDDLDLLDASTFTSSGTGHAVDLGTIAATDTMGWNCFESGYAAQGGIATDRTILVNVASGQTLTINVAAGASTPTYYNTGTGTVSVVSGQVTTTITVVDIGTGALLEDAMVLLEADTGGPLAQGTAIIDKVLTNASGVVSDTRSFASDQPVIGRVRRATPAFGTLYKTSPITGVISSASGLALTIQMIRDE